jgi:hypothetical protein
VRSRGDRITDKNGGQKQRKCLYHLISLAVSDSTEKRAANGY